MSLVPVHMLPVGWPLVPKGKAGQHRDTERGIQRAPSFPVPISRWDLSQQVTDLVAGLW